MTVICYRNLIDVELLYRANTFNVLNNGSHQQKVTHYITHVLLFSSGKTGGQVFERWTQKYKSHTSKKRLLISTYPLFLDVCEVLEVKEKCKVLK